MEKFKDIIPESKIGTLENHDNSRIIGLRSSVKIRTGHEQVVHKTKQNNKTYEALEVFKE